MTKEIYVRCTWYQYLQRRPGCPGKNITCSDSQDGPVKKPKNNIQEEKLKCMVYKYSGPSCSPLYTRSKNLVDVGCFGRFGCVAAGDIRLANAAPVEAGRGCGHPAHLDGRVGDGKAWFLGV